MSTLLLRNATIISVDGSIGIKESCDILIKNGIIEQVAQNITAPVQGRVEVVDMTNCLISPGFVDTHHHMWQQLLRSVCTDWSAADYVANIRKLYGGLFTPEDVYAANYLAGLDLINNGITTVVDHCHILNSPAHTDAAIKGLKDAGVRGTWCYGFYENPTHSDLLGSDSAVTTPTAFNRVARMSDAKRARNQHFSHNNPEETLLTFGGAPSEAEGISEDALHGEIDFFRSIGARIITAHVAMGHYDTNRQIVQKLGDAGYLGSDLLFSHGNACTDSELDLIATHHCGISATPETELQMGMGHPIAFKAVDAGCNVGLGIDVTSNQSNDMFASMRLLLQVERARDNAALGSPPLQIKRKSEEALFMATLGGSKSIGLDHLVGSITPGKRADLIVTRCDDMNVTPVINPVGTLMFHAHVGNIDTVIIDGKIRKRDGKVLHVDWPDLRDDLRKRAARVVQLATQSPAAPGDLWRSVITCSDASSLGKGRGGKRGLKMEGQYVSTKDFTS